jgi:hypothetical protein
MLKYLDEVEKNPKQFFSFIKFIFVIISIFFSAWIFYEKLMYGLNERFFSQAKGTEIDKRLDDVENKIDRRLEIIESDIKQILKNTK